MKIILNFLGLRIGGGRTDAMNLLQRLPVIGDRHEFLALVPAGCGYEHLSRPDNCRLLTEPRRPFNDAWRLVNDNLGLLQLVETEGADVLFTMCNMGPVRRLPGGCRHVVMLRQPHLVYDERHFGPIPSHVRLRFRLMRRLFAACLKTADHVLVQTSHMQERLLSNYRFEAPVSIIGKSISAAIRVSEVDKADNHPGEVPLQAQRIQSESGYRLLYLTKFYAHKNIVSAAEAIAELRRQGRHARLFLTLDSEDGPETSAFLDRLTAGEFGDGICNLGHVDMADIAAVYQRCDAVLMPSLLESFSATYLEAMAYGKPLIASDCDFARAIAGNSAAEYFNPFQAGAMTAAICRVMDNPVRQAELVAAGRERFRLSFTDDWNAIARRYLDVLEGPQRLSPKCRS